MRSLVLVIGLVLTSSSAEDNTTETVLFPDGGDLQTFSSLNYEFSSDPDVIFQLYTKSNPNSYFALLPNDDDLGYFDVKRPTRFIVHGWHSSATKMAPIKDNYLAVNDFNVILVDWSSGADSLYTFSKDTAVDVGVYLAELIDFLISKGAVASQIHIAGHSLGAHTAGVAGNRLSRGKLGKITGMDPALPFFSDDSLSNRLDKSDATFVEIIHTCGGLLGFSDSLGHADFYPNQGTQIQPGCGIDLGGACSHRRSYQYFSESIISSVGFVGYRCSNWDNFKDGSCFKNARALMGEYTDMSASGIYYLDTASSSPYARGFGA